MVGIILFINKPPNINFKTIFMLNHHVLFVATLKWSELRGTIGKYELQFS